MASARRPGAALDVGKFAMRTIGNTLVALGAVSGLLLVLSAALVVAHFVLSEIALARAIAG
jgi:hypothetical protein